MNVKSWFNASNLTKIFSVVLMYELVLGGGGRLINFGAFSPRMFLFTIALVIVLLYFLNREKVPKEIVFFGLAFLIYISYSFLIGLINDNAVSDILIDIKPLSYSIILLYIFYNRHIELCFFQVIKNAAIIMSLIYLIVIFVMRSGIVPFETIYLLNDTGEFFFRGQSGFVYKGFLYILLGAVLCFSDIFDEEGKIKSLLLFILLTTALYFTYARGFILSLGFISCFKLLLDRKLSSKLVLMLIIALLPIALLLYLNNFDARGDSDSFRLHDLLTLATHFDSYMNIFVGSGFGTFVNGRGQVEYSLLDILLKSGALGVIFWLGIYMYILISYFKFRNVISSNYLLLTTAVYFQSSFNPYMNNPIGIFCIMVSLSYFIRCHIYDKRLHSSI
ncbi:hypothetical protein AL539_21580 [Vibrio alginolyticus]|uniref:hypothetical protein n=1 Tax=Vibrio alginolyticus TaxID=663 RepID=UPI000CE99605|nr:hypothetical protein [Vibrio alginolyticus]AVF76127.1 hypothetical protein AL539_21580 [Vibrio alginolyticus]